MKTILYHANCYDGFGAAFAAWLELESGAQYIPVSYGKPPPEIEPGSEVWIVDFSYPADVLLDLARRMKHVIVLDHHATAQEALSPETFYKLFDLKFDKLLRLDPGVRPDPKCFTVAGNLTIQFDMAKSGAVLAWNHFHMGQPVPDFFLYLQDRDLWKFELPNSREVSAAVRSYPMDFPTWWAISGLFGPAHQQKARMELLIREGAACGRLIEQQVQIMASNHRWAHFNLPDRRLDFEVFTFGKEDKAGSVGEPFAGSNGHFLVPAANATVFFSEVGEKLLEMYPDAPFAAYYMDRAGGKRQWGLRSRSEFDCSKVALAFGGGGHKQAAGFVQDL